MGLLELTVIGDPVPKGRPRTAKGVTYTPPKTRDAENALLLFARRAMPLGAVRSEKPVGIAVEFFCATARRTDGDNLLKLVTDALNGLVYADDSQIEEWYCRVHRKVGKAQARTEIFVYELQD